LIASVNVSGCPESVVFPATWTLVAFKVLVIALFAIASALSADRGSPLAGVLPPADDEPPADAAWDPVEPAGLAAEPCVLPDELQPAATAVRRLMRHPRAA
jgi:hypothetical protein